MSRPDHERSRPPRSDLSTPDYPSPKPALLHHPCHAFSSLPSPRDRRSPHVATSYLVPDPVPTCDDALHCSSRVAARRHAYARITRLIGTPVTNIHHRCQGLFLAGSTPSTLRPTDAQEAQGAQTSTHIVRRALPTRQGLLHRQVARSPWRPSTSHTNASTRPSLIPRRHRPPSYCCSDTPAGRSPRSARPLRRRRRQGARAHRAVIEFKRHTHVISKVKRAKGDATTAFCRTVINRDWTDAKKSQKRGTTGIEPMTSSIFFERRLPKDACYHYTMFPGWQQFKSRQITSATARSDHGSRLIPALMATPRQRLLRICLARLTDSCQ